MSPLRPTSAKGRRRAGHFLFITTNVPFSVPERVNGRSPIVEMSHEPIAFAFALFPPLRDRGSPRVHALRALGGQRSAGVRVAGVYRSEVRTAGTDPFRQATPARTTDA